MPEKTPTGSTSALARRSTWLGILALALFAVIALGAGVALGSWRAVCHSCPSIAQIYVWEPKQSTKILSHDGQLIAELFQERRTPVAIADLPPHVPQAFIAIEDRRFYEHDGFDLQGMTRAALNLMIQRRIAGGGSTITQQLARNMFTEEVGFEQRVTRKLKELKVAQELEEVYRKEQILEAYINQINFGHGWYGIETAAQRYFGKPAANLDPAEAAMLAAVINRPSHYSPLRNPERALARRNLVLRRMAEEGYLSAQDAERWAREPVPERSFGLEEGELAPYFVEWVRRVLDERYGADLYLTGLRVVTSLDIEMQKRARVAMEGGWKRLESQPGYRHRKYDPAADREGPASNQTPYLQGAFLAVDLATGGILALIGGRDFEDSKFNRAVQAYRQPGSVFKPFVYAAALASGVPASHVVMDSPIEMEQVDGSIWSPRNFDRDFKGPMTLRDALKLSINTVAVKLGLEVGLEAVAQYARRLGINTPIPRYPAISIGSADVIPLEVVEAYTTFATQGERVRPLPILRVEDAAGRVLFEARARREQVMERAPAAILQSMLRDVVDRGTAYTIRNPSLGNLPYDVPAGGKTGTTNDGTDVWFVGFTPDFVAGVWLGFDKPQRIIGGAAGGLYAAPVWGRFMRSVYIGDDALRPVPAAWEMPTELLTREVDRTTGGLATPWCPLDRVYTEVYVPGTEPTDACVSHAGGMLGVPFGPVQPEPPRDTAESISRR